MPRNLRVLDLGAGAGPGVPYREALDQQMSDIEAIAGDPSLPHMLKFLQHAPVLTCGRTFSEEHLLATRAQLAAMGVELVDVSRGGSVTFHGPGQLVAYLHVDLRELGLPLTRYLRDLEQWVIDALLPFGLLGERASGMTGVWVGGRKVCAMGVAAKKFITYHGLSINIHADLGICDSIVPCGLSQPVANLWDLTNARPGPASVIASLMQTLPPWLVSLKQESHFFPTPR